MTKDIWLATTFLAMSRDTWVLLVATPVLADLPYSRIVIQGTNKDIHCEVLNVEVLVVI